MTTRVFLSADNAQGQPAVAEMHEFATLPRIGDHVCVDVARKQFILKVELVRHFPRALHEKHSPSEDAFVGCKVIEVIDL